MIWFKKGRSRKAKPVPESGIIEESGEYYLEKTLYTREKYGIQILAKNVNLDLNCYQVVTKNQSVYDMTFGIFAPNSEFCEIHNGSITGSSMGITATYSNFLKIQGVHIEHCKLMGINFGGTNNIITDCTIRNIADEIGKAKEAYGVGINACEAISTVISYNNIENIYRQLVHEDIAGEGVGILLGHDSQECDVSSNRVSNNIIQESTYGIWALGKKHLLYKNIILNHKVAICAGDSKVKRNIMVLERRIDSSIGISGKKGLDEFNIIVNYETDFIDETTKE